MNAGIKEIVLTVDTEPDKGGRSYTNIMKLGGVLNFFRKEGVFGTFFCTPCVAERFPSIIAEMVECGHEIGLHIHPNYMGKSSFALKDLPCADQKELLDRGKTVFAELGVEVVSFRSGGFNNDAQTMMILNEMGFTGDSSCFARKQPELALRAPFHPVIGGRQIDLVEFPVSCSFPGLVKALGHTWIANKFLVPLTMFTSSRLKKRWLKGYYAWSALDRLKRQAVLNLMFHSYDLLHPEFPANFMEFLEKMKQSKVEFITLTQWVNRKKELPRVEWM
jgi:hypothetical protein